MEGWELSARERIRDAIARYAQYADSGRFRELAALFDAAGVLEVPNREPLRGRREIEAFLDEVRAAAVQQPRPLRKWHHVASLVIDVEDDEHATASSYFSVVSESGLDHWGRYRDRFVKADGVWFFAARSVRVDGRSVR